MSEIEPLTVTLELPSTEFMDQDGGLFVRCPLTRTWVPLTDYYSENETGLLPIVGKVDYECASEHWTIKTDEEGNEVHDANGQLVMVKEAKEPMSWHEVVRILAPETQTEPEGGTVQMNIQDDIASGDKMA